MAEAANKYCFVDNYTGRVDSKGRVTFPADYRSLGVSFVMAAVSDQPLIEIFPVECLYQGGEMAQKFARHVASTATQLKLDKEGRYILSQELLDHINAGKKVVVHFGQRETIGLVSEETWHQNAQQRIEAFAKWRDSIALEPKDHPSEPDQS